MVHRHVVFSQELIGPESVFILNELPYLKISVFSSFSILKNGHCCDWLEVRGVVPFRWACAL